MPLPRPFGDPFGRPDLATPASEESKPPKIKKVAAPITAGAFSFQLGTPVKREPSNHDDGSRWWSPIGISSTPIREMSATPLRQSENMARPLTSLPSPFGGFKTPAIKLERDTDRGSEPKTRLSEMQAPTTRPSSKSLGKRRAPDFSFDEPEAAGANAVSPVRPMKALGQLGQVHLGESLHLEEVKKRVEEEGIGVSPRGKKIIKYTGKGPPPLSFALTNALSAQQSSLVLFYASMQSILYPSRTPKKSRMTPSALTEGALQPVPKCPTVLQHLRSAPLVVHVKEVIKGRTGHSVMCHCKVVKGLVDQPDLTSRNVTNEEGGQAVDTSMTLVLHALPPECTRLGLDPRIMTLKPPSPGNAIAYEIGVWPAWTDTRYDPTMTDHDTHDPHQTQGRGEIDATCHKVVFASRYLLADSSSVQ